MRNLKSIEKSVNTKWAVKSDQTVKLKSSYREGDNPFSVK